MFSIFNFKTKNHAIKIRPEVSSPGLPSLNLYQLSLAISGAQQIS